MPTIPTAADLGVATPRPDSNVPNVGAEAGAVGEAQARAGGEVVNLGNTVLDVHDEIAYANANSMLWQSKVALDQKYKNDPDPATAPQRYEAELQAISQQAAGMITRPRMQTQFTDMASRFVIARGVETVQNQADAAINNQAVAKLSDNADAGVTAFAHMTDPGDQKGVAQAYYGQVDAMVKARILDATSGEKLKKDFIHRAIYSNIANAGTPDEMIKRWNGFNGVEPDQTPAAGPSAALLSGVPDDYRAAIIKGESGGDVSKINPQSGAAGRYQFLPATAAQYGLTPADLTNPDPKVQTRVDVAFQKFTADNQAKLTASLGRPPTPAELSLAHQQGAAGAASLLANPQAKAVEIVGQKAVLDNGGEPSMTAQEFSQHVMGYYGASDQPAPANQNTAPAAAGFVNQPEPGSMASQVPADIYGAMRSGIQGELNAAQARIDHQQLDAIKAQELAAKQARVTYQQQMTAHWADPTKPDVDMVAASQNPAFKNDDTAMPALFAFQRALDKPPTDDGLDKSTTAQLYRGYLNGSATTKDFQDAFAPPDGSPGKISKANFDFLMTSAGSKDPDAKNINALKEAFLKNSDFAITHDAQSGVAIDLPMAHDADYRFMTDFQRAWDAKVAKGENPRDLITPGNKEYFGSQANMANYVKTAEQWMQEEQKQQDAANPQGPGLLSRIWTGLTGGSEATQPIVPPDLPKGTTYAGKLKDGRDAFRMPDGSLRAVKPPEAAAVPAPVAADTGPQVPTGQ